MAVGMPAAQNPYYDPYAEKGEEISSTFGGRHVNILEGDLVHPAHTDGFVDKGDPVSFGIGAMGQGVGIAFMSARATTDIIPVDTEGIWRCEVVVEFGIIVGQIIFITSAGVLVDWPPDPECHIFGYALQPITAGVTATIAVKVHWMDTGIWWWWFWYWWEQSPT